MTCGPGPLSWATSCGGAEGAHSRGTVARLLRGGSPLRPLVAPEMEGRVAAGSRTPVLRVSLHDMWGLAPVS
jgi:hypothetical protein